MAFYLLIAGAAAAAQPSGAHHAPAAHVDAAQAKAEGYAEAQRALAAQDGFTPDALAASLAHQPQPAPAPADAPAQSAAPAQAATAVAAGGQLNLTCLGAGTANKTTVAMGWGTGSFTGHVGFTGFGGSTSSSATMIGSRQQGFQDQIDIRLFGGDDRIRLPRTMLPGIHGGKDGWFKLKDVVADARSIDAHAAVSAFHNPKVHIDRTTGTISISGKDGDYSGECQAMQADAPARF